MGPWRAMEGEKLSFSSRWERWEMMGEGIDIKQLCNDAI
jgi:hypothetical protein